MATTLDTGGGGTVQITRPVGAQPSGDIASPKMVFSGGSSTVVVPYAPEDVRVSGLSANWQEIPRPGAAPLLERSGDSLATVDVTFVLRREPGAPTRSIEAAIQAFRVWAKSSWPVVVRGHSLALAGQWRVTSFSVDISRLEPGTNHAMRASCALQLKRASDGTLSTGPAAGGYVSPTLVLPDQPSTEGQAVAPASSGVGWLRGIVERQVRKREDFIRIAIEEQGSARRWRDVADSVGVTDPSVPVPVTAPTTTVPRSVPQPVVRKTAPGPTIPRTVPGPTIPRTAPGPTIPRP